MTQESTSGQAVAERVRAADIAVGGNSPVTAMLANSLKERKPLADTGELYDSVQEAENAASAFVFVPPGTFNESVTIDTEGLTLLGSGDATLIDGGALSGGDIVVSIDASNVTVDSVQVTGSGGNGRAINISSAVTNITAKNVTVSGNTNDGIALNDGSGHRAINCRVGAVADAGIFVKERSVISGCIVDGAGGSGIATFGTGDDNDDVVIANNIIKNTGTDSIKLNGDDTIVIGNRVINSNSSGISFNGADCIIANNRVSDSTNSDIADFGTGTTLDGNLTGASN